MEAQVHVSKYVTPFVPSLLHFSSVKVAFPLFKGFDNGTWEIIYQEMKRLSPAEFYEYRSENPEVNKAKEMLLLIPAHLRLGILQTIMGLHSVVVQWRMNHPFPLRSNNTHDPVLFKTDGRVDRIKTVQVMLMNEKISIESRFDLACAYFFGNIIKALWAEMQETGKATKPLADYNPMSSFWIKRMRRKYRPPWIYSVQLHLDLPEEFLDIPIPRFGAFFPYLRPIDRSRFITPLMKAPSDDFLLCLYSATKKEEMQVIRMDARKLIFAYLDWPMQNFFLKMMERMWNVITFSLFKALLEIIYFYHVRRKDFDYETLYVDFWESSPDNLKAEAKTHSVFYDRIKSRLDSIREKRKGEFDEKTGKRRRYELSPEIELAVEVNADLFAAYMIPHLQQLDNHP